VAGIAQAGRCRFEAAVIFGAQSETIRKRRHLFYRLAENAGACARQPQRCCAVLIGGLCRDDDVPVTDTQFPIVLLYRSRPDSP
jgi:hypothetical protein